MAPFDPDELERRMSRMAKKMEDTFGTHTRSFEEKMRRISERAEDMTRRASRINLDDFPNIKAGKRSRIEINRNGKKTIIEDGKVLMKDGIDMTDSIRNNLDIPSPNLFKMAKYFIMAVVVLMSLIFGTLIYNVVSSLLDSNPQHQAKPPALEQPIDGAPKAAPEKKL